jgi:transposase-like protein
MLNSVNNLLSVYCPKCDSDNLELDEDDRYDVKGDCSDCGAHFSITLITEINYN